MVALTLLPMLAARIQVTSYGDAARPGYGSVHRLLERVLDARGLALAGTLALLLVGGALVGSRPRELMPQVATDLLLVELTLPAGRDVSATDDAVREVESWLAQRVEVVSVFGQIGSAGSFDPAERERRAHRATIRARLDDRRSLPEVRDAIQTAFSDRTWSLTVRADREEFVSLVADEAALIARVSGPDPSVAAALADSLRMRANAIGAGIPFRTGESTVEPRTRLRPREETLTRQGLRTADLLGELEAATSGLLATRIRRFDRGASGHDPHGERSRVLATAGRRRRTHLRHR